MKSEQTVSRILTEPVGQLIMKNAVPTICSMMVTALYNTADTFFVSKLGTSASGAVGIIFSVMAIMQAFGFTIGMGAGSMVSRFLGAGNTKAAGKMTSTAIFMSLALGTALAALGTLFLDQFITKLGATPTILPYARDYARFIVLGTPFFMTSFVMNNQLRWQGMAFLAMAGLMTGGILNMGLDPLFIFALGLGIKGAAVATLVSQLVSFSILLSMFLRKKTVTELSVRNISLSPRDYLDIVRTGFPSFCRQGIGSLSMILLNTQAGRYGAISAVSGFEADAAIAAMAISNRIFMLLMSVALGLGQGFQPVCGMNFGAGKYGRVREGFAFLVKATAVIMAALAAAVVVFASPIARLFRDDPNVVATAILAMRSQAVALPLQSIIFAANTMLQTCGRPGQATFLSSLRQGLFFVPILYVLPLFVGIKGVQVAQAASEVLTALASVPFVVLFFRECRESA